MTLTKYKLDFIYRVMMIKLNLFKLFFWIEKNKQMADEIFKYFIKFNKLIRDRFREELGVSIDI